MPTLILTSSANLVLDQIIANLPKKPEDSTLAFIATASDVYTEKPWVAADRDQIISRGFKLRDVTLSNKSEAELAKELDVDIIFVAGGNVFYLLQELKKSHADLIIQAQVKAGTVYIGSSAGAMVAGPSIELFRELDHPEKAPDLKSADGMRLTEILPLVHFGHEKFLDRYHRGFDNMFNTKNKYICIRDDQALIIKDDMCKII